MKARFNRVPLLTLSLLSGLMGGCGLLGGGSENASVQQSPQPAGTQVFPSPAVPAANSSVKVSLTRPTNPDDRLRVIKTGRNDPFGLLVAPQAGGGAAPANSSGGGNGGGGNGGSTTNIKVSQAPNGSGSRQPSTPASTAGNNSRVTISRLPRLSPDSFSNSFGSKPGSNANGTGSSGNNSGGNSAGNGSTGSSTGGLNLPALPPKPELAGVKVTGVVIIAGTPRAIVEAPGEPTSRTVGIGDSLSNGQLFVKDIDASNSAEPVVIFRQGDVEFSVAVGRAPVLIASAGPIGGDQLNPSVRGLYPAQSRY